MGELTLMKAFLLPKKQVVFPGIVIHRVGPMRLYIPLSQDGTQHPYHCGQRGHSKPKLS